MDDVVAIEVAAPPKRHFFLTWGRVFDAEEEPLLEVADAQLAACGIDPQGTTSRLCDTLQEAANAPYFFEGLLYFAQQSPIPFGDTYETWARERREAMEAGREIYYLRALEP